MSLTPRNRLLKSEDDKYVIIFTMILKGNKTHVYLVSCLKYKTETCFHVLLSSPSSPESFQCVFHVCVFIFLLCYTEGSGLCAARYAASGELLGEAEDSLMFILRGREAYT